VTRTVTSRRDVAEVMFEGEVNRATGATAMNERSSRSHSIVIVHVEGVTKDTGTITRGVLVPRGPGGQRALVAVGSHGASA
jgi:kinesin family protein C2/C3